MPANHGGTQWPEAPMATFLSIFTELHLTPVEDERWCGEAEPDLPRSIPAAPKLPGWTANHDAQWRHSLFNSGWMSGKTWKTREKWG